MNTSHNIIITSLQSWDIPIGSNAIDIATELSKQNKVLYINSPNDLLTSIKKAKFNEALALLFPLKKKKPNIRKINTSLFVIDLPFAVWPINKLPDGIIFDFFNKLNNKMIFNYIKNVAKDLKFDNYIHFIDNDIYRSYFSKSILKPKLSIYYRRDNLIPFNYWKKHASRLEPALINKCDLVMSNSPELNNFAKQHNSNSYFIGQGVDLSAYNPSVTHQLPEILNKINNPKIGYIGDITSVRLNADLIYDIAKSRPNYSFLMIGPEDNYFKSHKIHSLSNVHFLGRIPKKDVPNYIANMDVCFNPQLLNEITIGNYPRKVDEYLAMGKPVVATKTGTMSIFKDYVYCCLTVEDYLKSLDIAINDNNELIKAKRIEFAHTHSWQNNIRTIIELINNNFKLNNYVLQKH